MVKMHFTRAPTKKEAEAALKNGATEFFMPQSALQRMSAKTKKLIESRGAGIRIESARGRPLEISLEKVSEVIELHRDNRTYREIEKTLGIPKSSAHYLIKYAERQKIKKAGKVVYL